MLYLNKKNKLLIALVASIFFYSHSLFALEFKCKFEEAYSNGEINTGVVLFKNGDLRYQYNDSRLFTIFINNNGNFLYQHSNKKIKKISKNLQLLKTIMDLAEKYPDIPLNINDNNHEVNIELSKTSNFIKRIAINSNRVNLSLYLKDCNLDKPINSIFFKTNPVFLI